MVPASWAAAIHIRIAAVDRDAGKAAAGTVVVDIAVAAGKAAFVEAAVEAKAVAVDSS